jgi:hypothetical protein
MFHNNCSLHCKKWSSFFLCIETQCCYWDVEYGKCNWIWQVHKTNLVIQKLSHLPLMSSIENMLQSIYNYFSHSPKHHLEFVKLVELMQTKGLNILKNIKMWRLSMLFPTMKIMNKYPTLLVKMQQTLFNIGQYKYQLWPPH